MDYTNVLQYIREGTGPNGWLIVEAIRPPTEQEKTTLSMRLNPKLVEEIRGNIVKAVEIYFGRKEQDYTVGIPVQNLQNIYEELYGCLVRFEILGFESLASFCLAIDGDGFRVCKIGRRYVLLPPLKPWYWPEPELEEPIVLEPEAHINAFPKDVVGPNATLQELNYKLYLKPGETMKITLTNYENPLNFHFILFPFFSIYEEFINGLVQFYTSNNTYDMPQELVRPGQFCVVDCRSPEQPTHSFGRARVLQLTNAGGAHVILIDSGKKLTVPINRVRFLHKQFGSFPVHSLPASLAGVVPKSSVLDEGTKTRINFYLTEPFLEAELYSPDFNRPMFPLILYSRFSKISLNRVLIDSGKFGLTFAVPYCNLTRKLGEINEKSKGNAAEEEHRLNQKLRAGWMAESDPLLSDFSDSDDENYQPEVEDELPTPPRSPADKLHPAASKPEPVDSQSGPRPVVSQPNTPETLARHHPSSSWDLPQSCENEERQENSSQEEDETEEEEGADEEEETEEEEETDDSRSQEPLDQKNVFHFHVSKVIKKLMKQNKKNSKTVNDRKAKEEKRLKMAQSKASGVMAKLSSLQRKSKTSKANKKSVDKPKKTSSLCSPSTSKEETNFDESESSEDTSEYDDYYDKNLDVDEVCEEIEMYILTIKILNSNSIIREITKECGSEVFDIAKSWAKYILKVNDDSLFDPGAFNPYTLYGNNPTDEIPYILRSLTEKIPRHLNKKFWTLSKSTIASGPFSLRDSANHNRLFESKHNIQLEEDDISEELRSTVPESELKRVRNMYSTTISIKKVKGKNHDFEVLFNETSFICNTDEVRMLSKIRNTNIFEKLNKNKRVVIKWSLSDTMMKIKMDRFQRFFFAYVHMRMSIDQLEKKIDPFSKWRKFTINPLFFKG